MSESTTHHSSVITHHSALGTIPCDLFGGAVQHSWAELYMLERVLDYRKPNRIVEIGTGTGRLTLYLAVWARCNLPCHVTTIDTLKQTTPQLADLLRSLEVDRRHGTCFEPGFCRQIRRYGEASTLLLYCDGGNKAQELREFAPMLGPGDVIMCHDFGTEVDPEQFGLDWCRQHGLVPLWPEVFEAYGCLNRAWQRRA